MRDKVYETRVEGVVCRQCTDTISSVLMQTRGVIDVKTDYIRSRIAVTYDPDIVSEQDLGTVLSKAGYPPGNGGAAGMTVDLLCLAAVAVLYFLFTRLGEWISIPALQTGATFGYVFLIGLLTGTHCIGMCGGILLSQTTDPSLKPSENHKRNSLLAGSAYNAGRLITATVLGAVFGFLGRTLTYSPQAKAIIFVLAGAAVLGIGLNMWGLIPGLRALSPTLPGACSLPAQTRKRWVGRPLLVGLLTGIMPCGASSAMWVFAMSTGSALLGAKYMFVWCLGTIPLLLAFSVFGSFLRGKAIKWMVKGSAVLIVALGLKMLIGGLTM